MLVQVKSRFFTAGLVISGGIVTKAAPILHFMVGWTAIHAVTYCHRREWSWMKVDESDAA